MTMSAEQRAWLKGLGSIVGAEQESESEGRGQAPSGEESQSKALFGIPGIPDVIPKINSRITIKNKTKLPLTIIQGSAKLENLTASFASPPPVDIDAGPGTEGSFVVTNDPPFPVPTPVGGTGGEIEYEAVADDAKKLRLKMKWERGGLAPSRRPIPQLVPKDSRFDLKGFNTGGDDFEFHFVAVGAPVPPGPGPGPGPGPQPTPAPSVSASCLITVVNQTEFELFRAQAEHERGDFMVPPPRVLAPNSVTNFASVETPGAKEQGCKGFIVWEVGSPATTSWRIEWDNPEGAKNNSAASLLPPVAGLRSQDVIGQGDENVTVSFALSGAPSGPGPGPGPGPVPPPEPEVPFEPPVKTKQPTFRLHDKSVDGWIEYAQSLLNFHLGTKLESDGKFGSATHAAVIRFQQKKKLQVDGVIGNQTWAALREGAPEKPSSDGRKPHTFVEKGVEARWSTESDSFNFYESDKDEVLLSVSSVGDTPLDPATEATVRVTPPGGKVRAVKVKIGEGTPNSPGEGARHDVVLKDFRKRFPSVPPGAKASDYLIEAYLPADLGGDFYSGKVQSD